MVADMSSRVISMFIPAMACNPHNKPTMNVLSLLFTFNIWKKIKVQI